MRQTAMNILVTGAKGFVGKNLCENLKNIKDGKTYVNHDVWVQTLDVPALVGGE